jgi:hypothetical protein
MVPAVRMYATPFAVRSLNVTVETRPS